VIASARNPIDTVGHLRKARLALSLMIGRPLSTQAV
jgi:hypothetical protein